MQSLQYCFVGIAMTLCYHYSGINGQTVNSTLRTTTKTTTNSTTTRSTTKATTRATTTCASTFCTMAPTESSYLSGPYSALQRQTYLLYSGNCVLEYQQNYATGKLRVTRAPIPISTYFGQAAFTGPVTLAFTTLTADDNYKLNLDDATKAQLTCTTDPTVSTGGVTCPSPAVAGAGTVPLSKATSASSMLNFKPSTPEVVQYVILQGNTELALYNKDFTTRYQQTTGFLTTGTPNGSSITKITAIQLMQDLNGDSGGMQLLAVYGTNASGVAYVGFVDATQLIGSPSQSLTNPASYTWLSAPRLLAAQFENLLTCP